MRREFAVPGQSFAQWTTIRFVAVTEKPIAMNAWQTAKAFQPLSGGNARHEICLVYSFNNAALRMRRDFKGG
jgi:hypothetical protein